MKICSNKDIKLITGALAASMLLGGCSIGKAKEKPIENDPNIKTEINLSKVADTKYDEDEMNALYRNYCCSIFSETVREYGGEGNVMISPASIMMALDMVAAGAKGETLQQLTDLFAKGQGPLTQQAYAASLMDKINNSRDVHFTCANAIWNNETMLGNKVNVEYVDYVKETFLAEYKLTVFDDKTPDEINSWIYEHTDKMIGKAVQSLDPKTVMVLVNAISFIGKWEDEYEDSQINDGVFTMADGKELNAAFLSDTTGRYFETEKATGFMKTYKGGEYAFLVILPSDESINANEFAKNFTAEDYEKFIKSVTTEYDVHSRMPEFKSDFEIMINEPLKALGVSDAFDVNKADLSGIAGKQGDLVVSKAIHKTHIEVDRHGTKAAAVTALTVENAMAMQEPEYKVVNCDRPFVYAIVDVNTMAPIFMGTVNEV